MKITKLPFMEKKEDVEYYLSLILRHEKVKAVIFEKHGNDLKYLNQAEEDFTSTIEDASTEDFLNTLDKVIGEAESVLPPNIESHKTLFGLKESWVEDNKIKKEYLDKLKKAGDELALEPIGFLIFAESIVNLLQQDEGAPITAVLVEIGNKYLTIYLVKTGKILEVKTSEIHESPALTVDTLLKHLQTPEVMPSRIIIFDGDEEDLTQEFLGFNWSKSLPFLHVPQIASLPEDSDTKAVLLGAAAQMNANLIFNIDTLNKEEKTQTNLGEMLNAENTQEEKPTTPKVPKDFFGFVEGTDVVKETPKKIEPVQTSPEIIEEEIKEIPEDVKTEEEQQENVGTIGVSMIERLKTSGKSIFSSLKKLNFSFITGLLNGGLKERKLMLIPIILVILVLAGLFFILGNAKAKVEIAITPKTDQKTQSVTLSPSSSTDLDNNVLSVKIVPVDESGSTTVNATGKKDVGTPAKGAVTIFNNDTDPASLASGAKITSANGLDFTLDQSVKIASATGDIFSGTKPGTASVNVTATDIGTDYNLPSDTKFTVGSSKTIAAKNDNAFSGGTKKSVTVVSNDDIAKLRTELPKSLSQKAQSDLSSKVEEGQTLLPTFVSTDLSSESFDKKADDQADSVTLTATVSFNFVAYGNDDMTNLANKLFGNSDVSVEKNGLDISAKNIKTLKNNDITADLNLNAKLAPKIDLGALSSQIAGENSQVAENQLKNISQVTDVTISISPHIPFLTNSLPKNPKNIEITLTSK